MPKEGEGMLNMYIDSKSADHNSCLVDVVESTTKITSMATTIPISTFIFDDVTLPEMGKK